jgi:predicted metalloprotease with PDZ domain
LSAAADTYATGGVTINWPAPLKAPVFLHVYGSVTKTIGYSWDYVTSKLKVFTALALATEKTNAQAMNTTVDVATDLPYFIGIFTKQ